MNDKVVMPVWAIGLFIVLMNTTMFNVSIPSIIRDLRISADLGSWIISSYSIGFALTTVIYSRLSDMVPIRKLLTIGLLILGLSSVLGLVAHDFNMLLAARILQSAGSGTMSGLGLVLASRYVPAERRGRAISIISAGSAMAFGLGPVIGGWVSQYWGWNGLFAVTCLILAVLPVLVRLLPKETPRPATFDIIGAALTVVNAASLLIAVTKHSLPWLGLLLLSFAVHAWHLRRTKAPFINPGLLRTPSYRKLLLIGFCILTLNLGNLFLMPLALAQLFQLTPMQIGLTIAPGAILSAFVTPLVGKLMDRYGNLHFMLIGHVMLAAVLALFAWQISSAPSLLLCGYLCFSPAFSATMASLNNETSRTLPVKLIGSGMGLMQLVQFCGGAISVAVCGLLLQSQEGLLPAAAYRNVYVALLAVCLLSLAATILYIGSRSASAVSRPAGQPGKE